jgi:hypothetical protein
MTFTCLNIELRTQPLIILIVIAGTDKECPGCSKIHLSYLQMSLHAMISKRYLFNTNKCIIKQLLNSVFVICGIIKVEVSIISLAFGSADNAYLDLDNNAYHKNLVQ